MAWGLGSFTISCLSWVHLQPSLESLVLLCSYELRVFTSTLESSRQSTSAHSLYSHQVLERDTCKYIYIYTDTYNVNQCNTMIQNAYIASPMSYTTLQLTLPQVFSGGYSGYSLIRPSHHRYAATASNGFDLGADLEAGAILVQ